MMDGLNSVRITRSLKAAWGLKGRLQVVAIGVVIIVGFTLFASLGPTSKQAFGPSSRCQLPAIYNFGDSNSDTGSVSAAFGRVPYPNGISFLGRPSGRYCDGRLIIDFIAEKLGLPYLSAFLDPLEGSFQHGADFAASGSTIRKVDGKMYGTGINPLSLSVQLLQFEQLKERTGELYEQATRFDIKSRLPKPEDFSRALYTFDIGQNDLHNALVTMTEDQVQKLIPELINQFASAIERLHQLGARIFWVHNTGPLGCLPYLLMRYPSKPENLDETGCIKSYNELAQEFNQQLKDRINTLRIKLEHSLLVYVDVYSAKYSLISNAKQDGFIDPLGYCCKHAENSKLHCWSRGIVNGTAVHATPCENPAEYRSWDSIHYTEAANKWVANRISDGLFSEPPLPISGLCKKPPPAP
uniref:Alpha-L-fucosidase n=1 Tax=Opuntia streptacantha TaxID=393608 RepID=A0A7C9ATI2_OPUST